MYPEQVLFIVFEVVSFVLIISSAGLQIYLSSRPQKDKLVYYVYRIGLGLFFYNTTLGGIWVLPQILGSPRSILLSLPIILALFFALVLLIILLKQWVQGKVPDAEFPPPPQKHTVKRDIVSNLIERIKKL